MVNIIDRDRVAKAKADILHVFEQIKTLVVEKNDEQIHDMTVENKGDLIEFINQVDAFLKEC